MADREVKIAPAWKALLEEEFAQPYFKDLSEKVRKAYLSSKVFPHPSRMFRAFELCAPKDVRVVILGQDPYHTPGVADGLAFSSFPKNPVPPSLENIYKETETDVDRHRKAPHPRVRAPLAALSPQRLLRQRSLQKNERVFKGPRARRDRVVLKNRLTRLAFSIVLRRSDGCVANIHEIYPGAFLWKTPQFFSEMTFDHLPDRSRTHSYSSRKANFLEAN